MGITYQEVVNNRLLSDEVIDCIPERCDCGAPIEFTNSLRQIYCTNQWCHHKIASRLESMAKAMKADGWGESTALAIVKEFKLKSPYQVFLLEGRTTSIVPAFDKKIANICDYEKRKVKLWELVKLAGIPNIETIAYKIFDGYNSIAEAYNDIEKGQVPYIADKLGIKSNESSVMAVNVYNTLLKYKEELLFGETQFNVYKAEGKTLKIAITGAVHGFTSKSDYIKYINERYRGKINAVLVNSVTMETDVLVADGDTSSNKFKTAYKINQKYGEKIFITNSIELIKWLDINASSI